MSGLRDPLEFAPNPLGLQSPIPGLVPPTTGNQGNQPVPEPPLSNRDNAPDSARQPTNNEKENAAIEEEREKVQKVHQKRKEFIAKLLVYKRPGIITESERKDYEATYMVILNLQDKDQDDELLRFQSSRGR